MKYMHSNVNKISILGYLKRFSIKIRKHQCDLYSILYLTLGVVFCLLNKSRFIEYENIYLVYAQNWDFVFFTKYQYIM